MNSEEFFFYLSEKLWRTRSISYCERRIYTCEETREARHCWSVQVRKKGASLCKVCVRCSGWGKWMSPRSSSSLLVLVSLAHAADGGRGAFRRRRRRGSRQGPAGRRRRRAGWREIPGRTAAGRTAGRERLDHATTALLKHLLLRKREKNCFLVWCLVVSSSGNTSDFNKKIKKNISTCRLL